MAQITTATIQALRVKTNAGMMDCKRALEEAGGDMDQAADILRKRGIAKAAKRSDREAKEGSIKILLNADQSEAYMVELTSETDFVSRNEKFQGLANELVQLLAKNKSQSLEEFNAVKMASGKTVQETIEELSGVIGEKIALNKVQIVSASSADSIGTYVHSNNKIGVAIVVKNGKGQEDLVKDLCMHVAASNPSCVKIEELPAENVAKEKEILRAQVINEGKPEAMADKIVEGKIRKYYEEVCLLEQNFVKDPEKKVKDIVAAAAKQSGKPVEVAKFVRLSIG